MHSLRARYDAIMVAAGTVMADDPSLTVRGVAGKNPARIVLDARGETDPSAKVYSPGRVICFTDRFRPDLPCHVEQISDVDSHDLNAVMERLYRLGFISLMAEGGSRLLSSVISSGLWDAARVEISPLRLGSEGRCPMAMPLAVLKSCEIADGNLISFFERM